MNPLDLPNIDLPQLAGSVFQGGFYAGLVRQPDGIYAVIVAPKAEGETTGSWGPGGAKIDGAASFHDGLANTAAMAEASLPLALWAKGLRINGFDDWYLPSRDELELCYRGLKPTAEENYTWRNGENPSALPPTHPYTDTAPAQTSALAFQQGNAEAFEDEWYWSSTQYSAHYAWGQYFVDGGQFDLDKEYEGRARAVRRFKVQ